MSLTSFMLGFDRQSRLLSCRPRSKSIEHKVRIGGIHALERCGRRLACTGCLRNFRLEFTDEARKRRASFGLPGRLSFRVRAHAMVMADRGKNSDRESVRVRLQRGLTRHLRGMHGCEDNVTKAGTQERQQDIKGEPRMAKKLNLQESRVVISCLYASPRVVR
jgi:hypothetical protein